MAWIKKPKLKPPRVAHRHRAPHVDLDTEQRIAHFLISHGRLERRAGRPLLHFLGSYKNFDDTIDYSVRTRVRQHDGTNKLFSSHIREYPSGHMRLVR